MKNINRLLGFGALSATVAFIALYALVIVITLPRPGSGMDATTRMVTWISVGGVIVALIAVHIVLGRQLIDDHPRLP